MNVPFTVWEGVYSSFAEAPTCGEGFSGDAWVSRVADRMRERVAMGPDASAAVRDYLLPVVVASAAAENGDVAVLDIGGGGGSEFLGVAAALPENIGLSYHVVDVAALCAVGREILPDDSRLTFHTEIPAIGSIDVVHLGSMLQYVDDWRSFVASILSLGAKFVLISDSYTGDVDTFVTIQNLWGSKVPFRILNRAELDGAFRKGGYESVLRVPYYGKVLNHEPPLPMDGLPQHCRIPHTWHCLFRESRR